MKVITQGSGWFENVICDGHTDMNGYWINDGGCYTVMEVVKSDLFVDVYRLRNVCGSSKAIYCTCPVCGNKLIVTTALSRECLKPMFQEMLKDWMDKQPKEDTTLEQSPDGSWVPAQPMRLFSKWEIFLEQLAELKYIFKRKK